MKKVCSFIAVILIFSLFSTCTLPTSIEITGNPKIRFAVKMDFNEMFSQNIKDGFNSVNNTVLECTKTPAQTFVIYMNLFNANIGTVLDGYLGLLPPGDITNPTPLTLCSNPNPPPTFTNMNITLPGFEFYEIYASLFISGSDIVQELVIDLSIGNENVLLDKDIDFVPEKSNFNEGWKALPALPNRGAHIDLTGPLNSQQLVAINYSITLPAGRTFPKAWIEEAEVQAELVVWIALKLEAQDVIPHVPGHGPGVDLSLSDFIGNLQGDFFGRGAAGGVDSITNYFETMKLIIEFSHDVFKNAVFYFKNDQGLGQFPISFSYPITGERLELKFDETTMEQINDPDYFPFVPDFIIHFDPGFILSIPPNFKSNYIRLEATLNTTIDLSGNN